MTKRYSTERVHEEGKMKRKIKDIKKENMMKNSKKRDKGERRVYHFPTFSILLLTALRAPSLSSSSATTIRRLQFKLKRRKEKITKGTVHRKKKEECTSYQAGGF